MSKGYVDVDRLGEIAVKEDGGELMITCHGEVAGEFDILIKTDALRDLAYNLTQIYRSAEIRRRTFRPVALRKAEFIEQEPIFDVEYLGCVVRPEVGQIDLQIEPVGGAPFQVSMSEKHTKFLFDSLLQVYNPESDKPS
jgi:hypothetical protein